MNRITTAAGHCIVAATIKNGWAAQRARFDDVIVTNAALSSR